VGTYQLGLAQLSEEKLTWKFSSAGLTDNYIKTLAWDGENLWFGFDYQQAGVNQYHLGKKFFKFHPLPKTRVILVDQDNIWFGTWGGLKKYVKTTGQWETLTTQNGLVANDITSLFSSPTTLWIGTYYGLNQLNKLNNQIKIHLKGEEVLVITGNENFIFAGNSRGEINRYSLTEKKWEKITYLPLLNQRISAMIAIKDRLWIGTEGTGIFVYSLSEEKWTQYRTGWQGEWGKLKSNYITCFLKKNEFLYLGTDKGLGRINLRNFKWQWLREKDGLVNEEILSLTLTDQDLWAGTWVGAVKIDENRF
jgi:ligand-binding sensor domain-containing protein